MECGFIMFIECDDVTAQNGQKGASKPLRRASFFQKMPPNLSWKGIFFLPRGLGFEERPAPTQRVPGLLSFIPSSIVALSHR
jgi:hypothetical protein